MRSYIIPAFAGMTATMCYFNPAHLHEIVVQTIILLLSSPSYSLPLRNTSRLPNAKYQW